MKAQETAELTETLRDQIAAESGILENPLPLIEACTRVGDVFVGADGGEAGLAAIKAMEIDDGNLEWAQGLCLDLLRQIEEFAEDDTSRWTMSRCLFTGLIHSMWLESSGRLKPMTEPSAGEQATA